MTMVADPNRSVFNRVGVGAAILITSLLFASSPYAQIQQDIDRCAGKEGSTTELQIQGCTALIESKAYAGKELAFAFNNRGLAYYHKQDFESALASLNQAIAL